MIVHPISTWGLGVAIIALWMQVFMFGGGPTHKRLLFCFAMTPVLMTLGRWCWILLQH
jgi:hypothetical protein